MKNKLKPCLRISICLPIQQKNIERFDELLGKDFRNCFKGREFVNPFIRDLETLYNSHRQVTPNYPTTRLLSGVIPDYVMEVIEERFKEKIFDTIIPGHWVFNGDHPGIATAVQAKAIINKCNGFALYIIPSWEPISI